MKNRFIFFASFLLVFISCKNKTQINNSPLTLTFYSAEISGKQDFNDEVANKITEQTGVTLDIFGPQVNSSDTISIMIANNQYPDLIYAKGDLNKLIEAEAVIPLDDYIEKYGQNLQTLYGNQLSKLKNSEEDPQIYSVGAFEIKNTNLDVSGTMQLQNEVLKEFGYPEIRTLDDMENILLAYKNQYPKIERHKTVGLSLLTDSWYWYLTLSNPANFVLGYPDDGQWIVDQETLTATYKYLKPEMNVFYRWLNKLYHEDLLDPESFTQSYESWYVKMTSGYVLATSYPYWEMEKVKTGLISNKLENRIYAYLPVTVSREIKDPSLKDYGFSGGWGIAISKSCKNPERAFKFLDWLCSEEAQILVNWGIKDKHYYVDASGKRISYKNFNYETSGVGKWLYPFPQSGDGYIDSTGNPLGKNNIESIINGYTKTEKNTLEAYGVNSWLDLFPSAQELGVSKHGQIWQYTLSTQMSDKVSRVDDYVKDELIHLIIDSPDNFDSNWEKMRKHIIEMGIEEVSRELTEMIHAKIRLWNSD